MLVASLKNKIINTYATDTNLELECRFGTFSKNRFVSGVDRNVFNRVKAYFDSKATVVNEKTTDYIMGKVRKSVSVDGTTVWITKERIWNEERTDYGLRYSMSREIDVSPITSLFKPDVIREKNRSSYLIFGGAVRIDLTLVSMNNKDTFEVEIELIKPSALVQFEQAINVTLYLVLDTVILYTGVEKTNLLNQVNSILGSTKRGYLDTYPLVQARNLKPRDMVYGGLVGGKTGYSVTHKTDGERRMLVFSESGVWLISANSTTRISANSLATLNGTILDGEMVPVEKRLVGAPKSKFWFLAFDTLSWNSNNSVQNEIHNVRMSYAQKVSDTMKGDVLRVNTKSFTVFETPDEFFKVMRDMFKQQLVLPYKQDGFMFTPENTVYNPHSDKIRLYKRNLTDYPDICKWKPKEELTIDLSLKWIATPEGKRLELYSQEKGIPVLFTKFQSLDMEHPLTLNLPNNTVVEYGYDYIRQMLVPHRVRVDKSFPNKKDVAEDVAEDILKPIEKETMQGDTFYLLRKYHNSVKKNLFQTVQGKTLLDIGSGYGGDLGKWRGYDKILAVEPDLEHIEEMRKRLVTYNMQDKVRIVQAGGQETEKITTAVQEWIGGKVDTVSSMLSLTFFWQSSDLVDSLTQTIIRNIKEDGNYVFLTMDGDLVEQTFEPAFGTGQVLKKLKLGPATLEYNGDTTPKELYIDIEGTIVEKQKEWLVRLDDLRLRFDKYGFETKKLEKADGERFLTEAEIIMTQMYSYGIYGRKDIISETEFLNYKNIESEDLPEVPKDLPKLGGLPEAPKDLPKLGGLPKAPKLGGLPKAPKGQKKYPILSMDEVEKLDVELYDNLVRIGSIGDGSCFFHSVLNAYLKHYQTNPDRTFRTNFVKNLREELASSLADVIDGKQRYDLTIFPELREQQLAGVDFEAIFNQKIDFSLPGVQKLLTSSEHLGDEMYNFASESLGIDIYVLRLEDDLKVHLDTYKSPGKRSVVIVGKNCHFEVVGLEKDGLYQTFFSPNDPFILKIRSFSK
tara:strand:+ start:348 stop:3398 length:3051 start_codon:yes stop_codon:yes gene_type:complete